MNRRDDMDDEGSGSKRRYAVMAGVGVLVIAVLGGGAWLLLSGDKAPPRKVHEMTIVNLAPPPPPPPPPPPQETPPPPEEQQQVEEKIVEPTPVPETPQEVVEDTPPDDLPPGPPLDGPPGVAGLQEGAGGKFLGGGGGGGGGGGSRWGWYASVVQSQISDALAKNEKTRHAVMRLQVRLWADNVGRITRVQLGSSTGNPELDSVLRDQVLGNLRLREPPPKDMPMPIITRITGQKPT